MDMKKALMVKTENFNESLNAPRVGASSYFVNLRLYSLILGSVVFVLVFGWQNPNHLAFLLVLEMWLVIGLSNLYVSVRELHGDEYANMTKMFNEMPGLKESSDIGSRISYAEGEAIAEKYNTWFSQASKAKATC